MSDMNTDTIYATASQYDIAAPAPVVEAQKLLETAEALRDSVAAESAPDLGTVTRKTLTKMHAALVDYENRDARLRAAEQLVKIAGDQFEQTKFTHQMYLEAPLAERFNDAAQRFTVAREELGGDVSQLRALQMSHLSDAWRELSTAATDLQALSTARDAFAPLGSRAKVINDKFEQLTRTAIAPDFETVMRVRRPADIDGWSDLIARGFVLRWQARTAQEANEVTIREHARAGRA